MNLRDRIIHLFSKEVKCTMKFGIFLPPQAENGKCPILYWLSGNTTHLLDVVYNKYIHAFNLGT